MQEPFVPKLENLKSRVGEFKYVKEHPQLLNYTIGQIQDNINYLQARDQHNLWNETVEFNSKLDVSRDSRKFSEVTQEFAKYV